MKRNHTRDDVARRAGVSSATVSRVFNTPDQVSPDKREAVRAAAESLGYIPNKSASSLRRRGSGRITLLEFNKPERPYYWGSLRDFKWFYAEVVTGVHQILQPTMYSLELKMADSLQSLDELVSGSDAVICYDTDRVEEVAAVAKLNIPAVLAHHTSIYAGYPRCSTDNFAGGYLQGKYLRERGTAAPLYITSFLDTVPQHAERLSGFRRCCREGGMKEPVVLESGASESVEGKIADAGIALLKRGDIDGIAAVNDITMALFCNRLLAVSGFDMLKGVPLCGYDAAPFRKLLPYSFASIDIRPAEIYRTATLRLLSALRKERHGLVSDSEESVVAPVIDE